MAVADYIPLGTRFSRLTTRSEIFRGPNGRWYVHCVCDCGTAKDVMCKSLRNGSTVSCGCYRNSIVRTGPVTHGRSKTPVWRAYYSMLSRCYNHNVERYSEYGGRGIKVCDRWLAGFEFFFADMGDRPDGRTLDRYPDVNGNYEPGNCRWATADQQANNKQDSKYLEWNGKRQTVAQWAREIGIDGSTIHVRIGLGWTVERTLTKPVEVYRRKR